LTSQWTYTVTHFDIDTSVETDITDDTNSIPMFTDTGSIEVNGARVVLSAERGKFLTAAPIIDQQDRIRIVVTDGLGGTYNKVFDVDKIIPVRSKSRGLQITLVLLGLERHLQRINYIKPHIAEGFFEVIEDIGDYYNSNRGTKQPVLFGHDNTANNTMPGREAQTNDYDFGVNEDNCFARLNEVIDKAGGSVDDGGLLDFFEIRFESSPSNFTDITMNVFRSGGSGTITITGEGDTTVNTGETEAGIDSEKATVLGAWGGVDQGALQLGWSKFKSKEQRFDFHPQFSNQFAYQKDSRVQFEGVQFKRINTDVTGSPPFTDPDADANWIVITEADEFGDVFTYSDYTRNRVGEWKDSGTDLGITGFVGGFGPGFFDGNMVVVDDVDEYFETWVDAKATDPANAPVELKYLSSTTGEYRGFRLLVNGVAAGILATDQFGTGAGKDIKGLLYSNSIIRLDETGKYRVLYKQSDLINAIANVIHEGKPYLFSGTAWDDVSPLGPFGTDGVMGKFHAYDELVNTPGILSPDNGVTDTPFTKNTNSAIRVRYDYQPE